MHLERIDFHEIQSIWCSVCPGKAALQRGEPYNINKLKELLNDPDKLEVMRGRLKDLSWFILVFTIA